MQCDFDIVGTEAANADADIVLLIHDALGALDMGAFTIRINHRGLFNRFVAEIGAADKAAAVLRAVDKLDKIGRDAVGELLAEQLGREAAAKVLEFIAPEADFEATLAKLERLAGGSGPDSLRLREIWASAKAAGAIGPGAKGSLLLDPSITRGLDYYTGVVFETRLDALPEIGSVCGGGRYDELASLYTKKRLPGVGAAIGLDRLLAALEILGRAKLRPGYTDVLVLSIEEDWGPRYQELASLLRAGGLNAEIYPEKKKLALQFAYAEKKGIPLALIYGASEAEKGQFALRDLASRENHDFPTMEALLSFAREKRAT
jgi:histidyl-tRNA synthetase